MSNDAITLVIRHRVKAGHEARYESWLRRITETASRYPGHLGVDVMRDASLFVSVLRFASADALDDWLASATRQALITEIAPFLSEQESREQHQGHEFWFVPSQSHRPPTRWKQALVTFLVILPLSLLFPQLLKPVFALSPWLGSYLGRGLLVTLCIVLSVVYLLMPRVTRLLAPWLNKP
ncbi:antibiotic biosynthesis monooxygenase [Gallaecimonas xiamenensis]|uniref:Antibiotic biosynthesis monooxygenase domain-containing protein n=1 Tax=Gallaecimonas xiamenensis 3-C-1 TaxID=745411 RepID=K2IXE2_9GAMM|nr:antibiotic biosynthesis monooxygenase [Gallaecimonas xiamenensis]EKE75116.1 antibiotic biosynthesis monooxygenase domain-containing protein [Gallaecimonas xiamenensis 3-C-1]